MLTTTSNFYIQQRATPIRVCHGIQAVCDFFRCLRGSSATLPKTMRTAARFSFMLGVLWSARQQLLIGGKLDDVVPSVFASYAPRGAATILGPENSVVANEGSATESMDHTEKTERAPSRLFKASRSVNSSTISKRLGFLAAVVALSVTAARLWRCGVLEATRTHATTPHDGTATSRRLSEERDCQESQHTTAKGEP
ncbi:hypothetical protein CSUI_007505 [Cystoisospora suis]|uniref:Uncharacterized protein n=1 Tax=Cystoisospora suis TaxID=483139 RepID=A0A2C6JUK6_9APIC|nr:hypothetical protein CSUI_007505 [Cystoisospora suis]